MYGFAGGDPVNYQDPFGLCKDEKGFEVKECEDISAETGTSVYDKAKNSKAWTYCDTPAKKDVARRKGDCTDFTEAAMTAAGLPSLATTDNLGATRTSGPVGFAASSSFRALKPGEAVRAGDIVEYAGHAGIASGVVDAAKGIQGMQNGLHGTQNMWFSANAAIYRRLVPRMP